MKKILLLSLCAFGLMACNKEEKTAEAPAAAPAEQAAPAAEAKPAEAPAADAKPAEAAPAAEAAK